MKNIVFIFIVTLLFNFQTLFSQNFSGSIFINDIESRYENMNEKDVPYTVTLRFNLNQYRVDSPVTMQIIVHAKEDNVSFTNSLNQFENYSFNVFDENNNLVSSSETYVLWQYRGLDYMGGENVNVVHLNQGETFSRTIDLNDWFDLKKTGRYRIEGNFFPIPDISKISVKTQTSYFLLNSKIGSSSKDNAKDNRIITDIPYADPSTSPPYEVVANMLLALESKNWEGYFANMFMPSIIMISQRYAQRYTDMYGQNVEHLSDAGMKSVVRELNFADFLKAKFGNSVTISDIQKDFGGNFVRNLEDVYNDGTVRTLAILYELNYRLSLPEEKKELFDEYKKYLASAYDKDLRQAFLYSLERKAAIDPNIDKREYYRGLIEMIKSEFTANTVFRLNNFEIIKTTIEEQYGLQTAIVETKLYERYIDTVTKSIYSPVRTRIFTLRKMGDYWYVVDYYDGISRS